MHRYSPTKAHGFALVTVLIFIQLFALLTLYAIQSNQWQTRSANLYNTKQRLLLGAEYALLSVESQIQDALRTCQVTDLPTNLASQQWWQTHACAGNFNSFHYYYVIEWLETDPCVDIDQAAATGADYYRISLLIFPATRNEARILLQSTLALPHAGALNCPGRRRNILMGRQSWHEQT